MGLCRCIFHVLLGYDRRTNQQKRRETMTEAVLENPDLFDLTMSEEAQPLLDAVKKHIKENHYSRKPTCIHLRRMREQMGIDGT